MLGEGLTDRIMLAKTLRALQNTTRRMPVLLIDFRASQEYGFRYVDSLHDIRILLKKSSVETCKITEHDMQNE